MRFTKLGHLSLDKEGAVLVIDSGTFTDARRSGRGHRRDGHPRAPGLLDADRPAALSSDPGLTLWANQSIRAQFGEFGDRVHEVQHGDALEVAGFSVPSMAWTTR